MIKTIEKEQVKDNILLNNKLITDNKTLDDCYEIIQELKESNHNLKEYLNYYQATFTESIINHILESNNDVVKRHNWIKNIYSILIILGIGSIIIFNLLFYFFDFNSLAIPIFLIGNLIGFYLTIKSIQEGVFFYQNSIQNKVQSLKLNKEDYLLLQLQGTLMYFNVSYINWNSFKSFFHRYDYYQYKSTVNNNKNIGHIVHLKNDKYELNQYQNIINFSFKKLEFINSLLKMGYIHTEQDFINQLNFWSNNELNTIYTELIIQQINSDKNIHNLIDKMLFTLHIEDNQQRKQFKNNFINLMVKEQIKIHKLLNLNEFNNINTNKNKFNELQLQQSQLIKKIENNIDLIKEFNEKNPLKNLKLKLTQFKNDELPEYTNLLDENKNNTLEEFNQNLKQLLTIIQK